MSNDMLQALCGREDPLTGFFYQGRRRFSDVNHHMLMLNQPVCAEIFLLAAEHVMSELGSEINETGELHAKVEAVVHVLENAEPDLNSADFRSQLLQQAFLSGQDGKAPLIQMRLFSGARKSCIYLGISHAIADIQAAHEILCRLREVYEQLLQGISPLHVQRPFLPLQSVLPEWNRPANRVWRRLHTNMIMPGKLFSGSRTRAGKYPTEIQGRFLSSDIDFLHRKLPAELQSAVLTYSRQFAVSVNAIFSAALVIWLRSLSPAAPASQFTIAVNLRGAPGWPVSRGFRSGMVNASLQIPAGVSGPDLCKTIQQQTEALKTPAGLLQAMALMENAEGLMRSGLPSSMVYRLMHRAQSSNVLYSNPGRAKKNLEFFGEARVLDWCEFGCLVPPYGCMFLTPMLNQQLQLDVVFSRKRFPHPVEMFVEPYLQALSGLLSSVTADTDVLAA